MGGGGITFFLSNICTYPSINIIKNITITFLLLLISLFFFLKSNNLLLSKNQIISNFEKKKIDY